MEKQSTRDSLIENIESELKKDAEDIDGVLIDRRIDELYALDGLSPPRLSKEALAAAARTVRSRAAWRLGNRLAGQENRHRFTRRAVRCVCAACCALLFLFSANYAVTRVTGSCLPSKAGIKICGGTRYCPCGTARGKETNLSRPE
jgi:hypothetical protein